MFKKSSKEAISETNNKSNSNDDWQNSAKASSVEKLEFAMAKLRKIKVRNKIWRIVYKAL